MAARARCLQESTIWGFLHRDLAAERVTEVRRHLDACATCRTLVASVARGMTKPPHEDSETEVDPRPAWSPEALEGRTIAGKYRVDRVLGQGGVGYVVSAEHLQLGTRVALKLLRPGLILHEEARARFLREARATAHIRSPYVVRLIDVGILEDGAPLLVMELLEGRDLAHEQRTRGALPVAEAVRYVVQAAHALAEAHRAGIIHRDLKPANLFLVGATRTIKLLDFGLSKQLNGPDGREEFRTSEASWLGTPRYMAPEQLKLAQPVDQRTDVWGLGMVLHELIAGASPFPASSIEAHCRAVLESAPIALDVARPGTPAPLARAVARCLAKDPSKRYGSVAELAQDLAPFLAEDDRALVEEIASATPMVRSRPGLLAPGGRRRRVVLALAVAIPLVAAAVGIGLASRRADSAPSKDASEAQASGSSSSAERARGPLPVTPDVAAAAGAATEPPPARTSKESTPRPYRLRTSQPRRNAEFGTRR
jgi:serine/threonine-protein kinase